MSLVDMDERRDRREKGRLSTVAPCKHRQE